MKRRAIPISWDDASFSSSPADFLLELDLTCICMCVCVLLVYIEMNDDEMMCVHA